MEMYEKLKDINVFKGMNEVELKIISKICKSRNCKTNEIIFEEKSKGSELYLIFEGSVGLEVSQYNSDQFHKFCTIPSNEVVGDLAFIDNISRSSRAVAITELQILYICRDDLYECLESYPRMGYFFMKNLAELIAKRLRLTNNIVRSSLDLA